MRFALLAALVLAPVAHAQATLGITTVNGDRPTLNSLGVQVLITGDTNRSTSP